MTDVVDKITRSRMMAGIHSKNTKPEIVLRKALHRLGLRYRLHCADIPGSPDLTLKAYRCVIFINGCFWHGHQCAIFKWPKNNAEFWKNKITKNMERDSFVTDQLSSMGWLKITVWECEIRQAKKNDTLNELAKKLCLEIKAQLR